MRINSWLYRVIPLIPYKNPRMYAETFLIYITRKSKNWLLLNDNFKLTFYQIVQLNKCIDRLRMGEPLSYIIKRCDFWSLTILLNHSVFIPRPDTEILVEQILSILPLNSYVKILELGTGSGAISLAIAKERPFSNIIAVDCSIHAINLASYNAKILKLSNVSFFLSNWFSIFSDIKFDLIVSNPPYLSIHDIDIYNNSLKYEPYNALFSENNGMYDIKFIIDHSFKYLRNNGWLLLEHDKHQGDVVRDIFFNNAFIDIFTLKDYHGCDRITLGRK